MNIKLPISHHRALLLFAALATALLAAAALPAAMGHASRGAGDPVYALSVAYPIDPFNPLPVYPRG